MTSSGSGPDAHDTKAVAAGRLAAESPAADAWTPLDRIAAVIVVAVAAISPAFMNDDAAFFNYFNNIADAPPFFYYGGYVPLIPEMTGWLLSPLSPPWQAVLYRVVPTTLLVVLYRQTARVLCLATPRNQASVMAFTAVLAACLVEPHLAANLSYANWTAILCATMAIVRMHARQDEPHIGALAGLWLAAISFPVAGVLCGAFVWAALATVADTRRRWLMVLVATLAVQLPLLAAAPENIWNDQLLASVSDTVAGFSANLVLNTVTVLAVTSLFILCAASWRAAEASPKARAARVASIAAIAMTYVTVATLLAYVVSTKFAGYLDFRGPYIVPAVFCGVAALALLAARQRHTARQAIVASIAALTLFFAAERFSKELRGPLELALMKYRFLAVASDARNGCVVNDPFVFEAEASSPILFCRRLPASEANQRLETFAPSVGARSSDDDGTMPYVIDPATPF